jgi:hypothetical protein
MARSTVKSALPRVLMAAALLGGAGSVLSAGSAEAATGCDVGIAISAWVVSNPITCGDKIFTFDSAVNLPTGTVTAFQNPLTKKIIFSTLTLVVLLPFLALNLSTQ